MKAELLCVRYLLGNTFTFSRLYLNKAFFCDVLEDKYRDLSKEEKVPGKTAIPCGIYKVVLKYSPKFKRIVPMILDVPKFTFIEMHAGNTVADTDGCQLVGKKFSSSADNPYITNSRKTLDKLVIELEKYDEITTEIKIAEGE